MGMVDGKKQAAMDQAAETIGDQFPTIRNLLPHNTGRLVWIRHV